jgi:hypothetical protein
LFHWFLDDRGEVARKAYLVDSKIEWNGSREEPEITLVALIVCQQDAYEAKKGI